ncbi:MAG: hypothetical protein V3V74_07795 [Nitrosomonadaceae bacterium]
MSYARSSENGSDVYVFSNGEELFCSKCDLVDTYDFSTSSWPAMIEHLKEHVEKGDVVPDHTFERLNEEIEEADGGQPRPRNKRLEKALKKIVEKHGGVFERLAEDSTDE